MLLGTYLVYRFAITFGGGSLLKTNDPYIVALSTIDNKCLKVLLTCMYTFYYLL